MSVAGERNYKFAKAPNYDSSGANKNKILTALSFQVKDAVKDG